VRVFVFTGYLLGYFYIFFLWALAWDFAHGDLLDFIYLNKIKEVSEYGVKKLLL
jgi:hypothetical protein